MLVFSTRVSSKQTKINFGSNRNKPKQDLFRVCFVKPKRKNFRLFQCFKPISKQLKQTDLFRNKPKQPETTLNCLKNFSEKTETNEKNEEKKRKKRIKNEKTGKTLNFL
jgi:hypothetical protein